MKNKGFTLVELLAVIVVLSIIALIGYSTVGNIISSTQDNSNKVTMKNYAKAVDQAVFLYEMNNDDSNLSELNANWLKENVKFEKATVECEYATYDKTSSLYGCKVNNSDKTYCYTSDTAVECNKDKLSKIYGESIQNGIPTPTSPIEIESVGEKTKNLLSSTTYGEYNPINLYAGTFFFSVDANTDRQLHLFLYDENKVRLGDTTNAQQLQSNGRYGYEITISSKAKYYMYAWSGSTNEPIKPMLEEGSTATSYEPYGYKIPITVSNGTDTKTTNIYLKEPLRKIREYADYLDLTNKKVVRYVKEDVFTGTETINLNGNNRFQYRFEKTSGDGLCNYYKNTNDKSNGSVYLIYTYAAYFSDTRYNTVEEFKNMLATQYNLGNPVKIVWRRHDKQIFSEESIDVPELPTLTGNVTYSIGTSTQPSKIEYEY